MERRKFSRSDNPLIDEILQKYRDCSTESMTGPKGLTANRATAKKPWSSTDDFAKHSYVSSSDHARAAINKTFTVRIPPPKGQDSFTFKETIIDGVPLACFSSGGEKRVCYTELVNKVLKDFENKEIDANRDRLQICCPRCSSQQLELFKLAGVLPWSSASASFISKTDSFRLIGVLTASEVPRRSSRIFPVDSLEVYHECFGGCVGTLEIDKYTDPYAKCITCSHCDGIFSPRRFVIHNHSSGEIHTCHWGFDDAKWRLYLMLCNEQPTLHVQKLWEMLLNKFSDGQRCKRASPASDHDADGNERDSGASTPKKARVDDSQEQRESDNDVGNGNSSGNSSNGDIMCRRSAFRPWSPLHGRIKANETSTSTQGLLATSSPARLFSPHTIPYLASDSPYNPPPHPSSFHRAGFHGEIRKPVPKVEPTPASSANVSHTVSEILATPSTKDPRSLEKTAKEMLEVVAQNERWTGYDTGNKRSPPRRKLSEEKEDNDSALLEEEIYGKLASLTSKRDYDKMPSPRELSSLLAKEIKDLFSKHAEDKVKELAEMKNKLRSELESLQREHTKKMEEALQELKSVQKEARMLQTSHRLEMETLNEKNIKLQLEIKRYKAEKEGILPMNSKETLTVLQQDVRDLSKKLEEKDIYCRELENEIQGFHSWINSQRLRNTNSQFVYAVNSGLRRDPESVIRTGNIANGNLYERKVTVSKSNGSTHSESSGDE
ncbi:ski oncogene-like [Montipora foliosa]|uniref:ski oncogene-like n=1 Tax=Montipora foliosa TaxID=591990 RepID=UPI0035F112D8